MKFYSQVGQDQYLLENFFRGKRGGVFVDVGAYDGEKFSNTLFFERTMGWTGLCIEPLPSVFAKLKATRTAICENVCAGDFEGEAEFTETDDPQNEKMLSGLSKNFGARHRQLLANVGAGQSTLTVPVKKLSSLLEKHGLFHVDYCSIDTEGTEEAILAELDLERFHVSVFTVEHNLVDDRLLRLMGKKGYDLVGRLEQDFVFKRRDVKRLAQTSAICAVWHKDPKRFETLRGHMENLARQSVPVQPIYVFDGGDEPPAWLEGRAATVREALTIYQAWNVALSLVDTPLAMNLNLDDRLAPDAVEVLQNALLRTGASAAGGDWKICYSQAETDAVKHCYPAERLPLLQEWPPMPGSLTRLGTGEGERGTYGPATIWRMAAHIGAPRYPYRMADGTLIRGAGDAVWWAMLGSAKQGKPIRLPTVIGNYHSHPSEQAEFRTAPDEVALIGHTGTSLL